MPPRLRSLRRALARALLLLALVRCATPAPDPGAELATFLDDFLEGLLERDPEWASELRLFPDGADPGGHLLTDVSPAAAEDREDYLRESLARLRALDADAAPAARMLDWYLDDRVRGRPFLYHGLRVDPVFGVQNQLVARLTQTHAIASERDALDYLARLEAVPEKFAQLAELLDLQQQRGILPPAPIVERVLDQLEEFVEPPLEGNRLRADFARKLAALGEVQPERRAELLARADAAIADGVLPAWRELIARFEALRPVAPRDVGVWRLPDGDAYYRHLVRHHTTRDLEPEALHRLGHEEVARIQAEMLELVAGLGIPTGGSFAEVRNRYYESLPDDGSLGYPDDSAGRIRALADYQALVDEAGARLGPLFFRMPAAPVRVERIPAEVEDSTPAHYRPPSFDGSRPGVFFANLKFPPWRPFMPPLTYHETIPGHHLHLALVAEEPGLSRVQRVLTFTAQAEGWALYAERLAREQGLMPDPSVRFEALNSELFRAARLVVDTGLHHRRWSRQQALDYMASVMGGPMEFEIDRYIVMPGQALAYKSGELEILRLRADARRRLGADFDLRGFHEAVIGGGHLPLPLVAERVEAWVAGGRP